MFVTTASSGRTSRSASTEYLLGFGLAAVTGVILGLLLGMNRRLQYFVEPWLDAIYATPTIALVPLIIIILGLGLEKAIFVVWLEAIFVIVVTVMTGVHSVERSHLRYGHVVQSQPSGCASSR